MGTIVGERCSVEPVAVRQLTQEGNLPHAGARQDLSRPEYPCWAQPRLLTLIVCAERPTAAAALLALIIELWVKPDPPVGTGPVLSSCVHARVDNRIRESHIGTCAPISPIRWPTVGMWLAGWGPRQQSIRKQ